MVSIGVNGYRVRGCTILDTTLNSINNLPVAVSRTILLRVIKYKYFYSCSQSISAILSCFCWIVIASATYLPCSVTLLVKKFQMSVKFIAFPLVDY